MSFRDNAWLSDGCNEMSGRQLVYDIKEQRVVPSTTSTGGGRVRIVIQPNSQSGDKPCAAPGKTP